MSCSQFKGNNAEKIRLATPARKISTSVFARSDDFYDFFFF